MAFVYKNKRFEDETKQIDLPFYKGLEENEQKENLVPFGVKEKRMKPERKERNRKRRDDFVKYYNVLDKKKKLVYKRLIESRLNKSNFSKEHRFKKDKSNKLGPGTYDPYLHETVEFLKRVAKPTFHKHKKTYQVNKIVQSSIPYKRNDPNDKVIIGEREMYLETGTGPKVGPGKYNISKSLDRRSKGILDWRKVKDRKLILTELVNSKNPKLGPGTYNPNKNSIPQHQDKGLSSFLSKQPKSELNRRSINSENMEWERDAKPGPGHYNIAKSVDKPINNKFQFFGSGAARIRQEISEISAVGPGSYNQQSDFTKYEFKNKKLGKMGFGDFQRRFSKDKESNRDIGPGAYLIDNSSMVIPSFNKKGFFANLQSRFKKEKEEERKQLVKIDKSFMTKRIVCKQRRNKQERPFKSKIAERKESFQLPSVGKYNPINNTISYEIVKKSHNKATEVAFMSKVREIGLKEKLLQKRLKKQETKNDENEFLNLFRNVPFNEDLLIKDRTKIKNNKFILGAKRFSHSIDSTYKLYNNRPDWINKSYNINF